MEQLPAWALVPGKVFSTGQTLQDFITLARVQAMLGGAIWEYAKVALPPVLTDENYVPKNDAPGMIAVFCVLTVITFVIVGLRIYSRLKITPKKLVIEDYTLFFGAFLIGAQAIIYIIGLLKAQWGMEVADMTWHSIQLTNKLIIGQFFITSAGRFVIRISAMLFIRRLYVGSGSRMVKVCVYMIYMNLFFLVATFFILIFQCGGRGVKRALWDLEVQAEKHISCRTVQAVWAGNAIDLFCDTTAILLPLRVVYNMFSAPLWKRMKVFALLGLGFTAWGAAIWRFVSSAEYEKTGKMASVIEAFIANHVECILALLCACLPSIQGLVSHLRGKSVDAPSPGALTPPRQVVDVEKGIAPHEATEEPEIDVFTNPFAAHEQQKQKKQGGWGRFMYGVNEGSLFSTRHTATIVDTTQRRPSVATIGGGGGRRPSVATIGGGGRRPSIPMLNGIPLEEAGDSDNEKDKSEKGGMDEKS